MNEDLNLNTLTSHPSYARSISLEIGRGATEDAKPKPKTRRSSRKVSEEPPLNEFDELISSDLSDLSDLSEYFSAEEDFDNLNIDKPSRSGAFSSNSFADNDYSDSDDYPSLPGMAFKGDKVRAPSKKQKRRRRNQLKTKIMEDFSIPFQDVENLSLEIEDFKEDVESSAHNIQKELPSLLELCLKSVWSKPSASSMLGYSLLPNKIKEIVNVWKRTKLYANVQYSWLNRILADCEIITILQTYHAIKEDNDYTEMSTNDNWVFAYKTRNVWTMQSQVEDNEKHGCKLTCWLNHAINAVSYSAIIDNVSGWSIYMTNLLSVLCSMIDLILEHMNRHKQSESGGIFDQKLLVVRNILEKRYPNIVKTMFDDAIPYVYWAHGNKHAANHFLKLAQKYDGERRALLLSEAARFYTQLNDPSLARKLYLQAADGMYETGSPQDADFIQIKMQMLMLLANIFDQGPMTTFKTKQSLDSWKAVLQVASTTPLGTWLEAVDAFFCYHCGIWSDEDKTQLEVGEVLLESLVTKQPSLYLHLSLIQTLLGQESLSAYKLFKQKGHSIHSTMIPGQQFTHIGEKISEHNPWKVLAQSQVCLSLLKVMWRTQLQYMHTVVDKNVISESDVRGSHMNFRLSSRGHLTGDFQMLLPPIKTIELDIYTGQQIFVSGNSVANTWYFDDFSLKKCSNTFYNPTMTEIYNQTGIVVQMLNVSGVHPDNNVCLKDGLSNLYWTGKNGETARLNLFRLIKKAWKEVILKSIDNIHDKSIKPSKMQLGSKEWVDEMKECVEYLYQREGMLSVEICDSYRKEIRKITKNEKEKEKDKCKAKKPKKPVRPCITFPNRVINYVTYGHTLLIVVQLTESRCGGIFIDCSNKESFLNPHFEFTRLMDISSVEVVLPFSINQVLSRADVIWMYGTEYDGHNNNRWIYCFDQGGDMIYKYETDMSSGSYRTQTPLIIGRNFFGVVPGNNELHAVYLRSSEDEPAVRKCCTDYNQIKELYVLADRLLLQLENKLVILDPETLESQSIHVSCTSLSLQVKHEDKEILGNYSAIKILSDQRCVENGNAYTKLVLAVDCHLLILHVDEINGGNVNIVLCIEVAGHPTEYCFVNQQCGFLVSTTQHYKLDDEYRENLFLYDHSGKVKGILPFLGPGPHDMSVMFLCGDDKTSNLYERLGHRGWYLFLRDGHGGIMSVWLGQY